MVELVIYLINFGIVVLIALLIVYWVIAPLVTVPFFASSQFDIVKLLKMAELQTEDKFIDLGSGDGKVVLAASKLCRLSVGIEHNPFLNLIARFRELVQSNGTVEFKNINYQNVNLAEFSVVYLYLNISATEELAAKLSNELTPGARVLSHNFKISNWKPTKVETAKDGNRKYYLYVIGEHN